MFRVSVPGRETSIELNLATHTARITPRDSGIWDGLVALHKSPGQHLANIRMNWFPMLVWRWFADGTVYLVFFISISGVYLWAVLRAQRGPGLTLLAAGILSFIGIVYAVIHLTLSIRQAAYTPPGGRDHRLEPQAALLHRLVPAAFRVAVFVDWPCAEPAPMDFRVSCPEHNFDVNTDLEQNGATIHRIDLNAWGVMRRLHTFTGVRMSDAVNERGR